MYDVMKNTVTPPIEFAKGIPTDLEQDHYLDASVPNLLVMDDLMSLTSKDPRINEIFYADSHHRNTSVITINQNMYFNKDPTQRRNCHYLILFNNPVDKQSIMTLGRQMYPSNSQYFARHFEDAVSKPYGYLLVDLKATTDEHRRLRGNALTIDQSSIQPIRSGQEQVDTSTHSQSIRSNQEPTLASTPSQDTTQLEANNQPSEEFTTDSLIKCLSPCQRCGIVFFTEDDLTRHQAYKHKMHPCEY